MFLVYSFQDITQTRHGYLGALKRIHMHQEEEGPTSLTKALCFFPCFSPLSFPLSFPSLFQCGWVCLGETTSQHLMQEKGGARSFPVTMAFIVHKKLKESWGWGVGCLPFVLLFVIFFMVAHKRSYNNNKRQ